MATEVKRANLLGWASMACGACAPTLVFLLPLTWDFELRMACGVACSGLAIVLAVSGMYLRRKWIAPRPWSPVAGLVLGVLALVLHGAAWWLASNIRHM